MIKKILLFVTVGLFAFRLWQTTGCRKFFDYHFNPLATKISVEDHVNTDGTLNRQTARFFHNKLTTGINEYSKSYLKLFEPRLLLDILGPLGLALVILTIFKINNQKFLIIHLSAIFITATLIFTPISSKTLIYLFAVNLMCFSLWGMKFFPKIKWASVVILLTAVATYWYYSYSWQIPTICNQIFFN